MTHPDHIGSRSRALARAASLLAALLLLLGTASAANAGVGEYRLGVVETGVGGADLASMSRAGVEVLRTGLNWSRAETRAPSSDACDGNYNWSLYDPLVSRASVEGIDLVGVIAGSPAYAASQPSRAPDADDRYAMHSYGCFVRALVARYGLGGDYVSRLHPGAHPVRQWQVYNEPNVRFYAVEIDPNNYGRLLHLTHDQIAREDPGAKVILAGGPELIGEGITWSRFLRILYRIRGIERKFDAVAFHPYAGTRAGLKRSLVSLDRTLERVGDARTPVWITETGFASNGAKGHYLTRDRRGQARALGATLDLLRSSRRRFNIGTIAVYRWRDAKFDSDQSRSWIDYAGLFGHSGNAKPACRAFVAYSGGDCRRIGSGRRPR